MKIVFKNQEEKEKKIKALQEMSKAGALQVLFEAAKSGFVEDVEIKEPELPKEEEEVDEFAGV